MYYFYKKKYVIEQEISIKSNLHLIIKSRFNWFMFDF